MAELQISDELALPLEVATDTMGILAKKGAGKSNAAVVLAEEMWGAGIACVAIDPKGDWWGVRSSADGKGPGVALPVFGGRHGDLPLEATSGAQIADLALGDGDRGYLSAILDVSQLTLADQRRFLKDFGQRLFVRKDEEGVLHLVLEEAHEYLPQMVGKEFATLVGVWQRIVKQGRFKGLGVTVVSQRSASLNKDVLTQIDSLIVLRTLSPQDRAVVKAWVDTHADATKVLDSLPSLADGEAWLWSPERLAEPVRFRFRRRATFDSGATPKVGQARRAPATLADVDLAAITAQLADAVERAKADDPKELRRRIKALEAELATARAEAPDPVVERVEVPVLKPELVAELQRSIEWAHRLGEGVQTVLGHWIAMEEERGRTDLPRAGEPGGGSVQMERGRAAQRPDPPRRREPRGAPVPGAAATDRAERPLAQDSRILTANPPSSAPRLKAGARRILAALARQHPMVLTRAQAATLAGLKVTGGTFSSYWSSLKTAGLLEEVGGEVSLTEAGLAAAGVEAAEPMGTEEVLAMWRGVLKRGAREMLDALVEAYPDSLEREQLAVAADVAFSGGTFGSYLSSLRRNGLVDVNGPSVRASDTLFLSSA